MKIKLERQNNAVHFLATSEDGSVVNMDGSEAVGGQHRGIRPMQLLIAAMGGCSGIDIVAILNKQRQEIAEFSMEIDAESAPVEHHTVWRTIHAQVVLKGSIEPQKAIMAANLSFGKYCSVAKLLEEHATITFSIELNGEIIITNSIAEMND